MPRAPQQPGRRLRRRGAFVGIDSPHRERGALGPPVTENTLQSVPGRGPPGFMEEQYRAWILDSARQQFSGRPSSDEVRLVMHGPPPAEAPQANHALADLSWVTAPVNLDSVDVWFSAGPVGPTGPMGDHGECNQGNTIGCRLYRVRLNLATRTGSATKLYDLTGLAIGVIESTVNHRGRLSFVLDRGWDTVVGYAGAEALVSELADGSVAWVRDFTSKAALRPEKPTYWTSDKLLWGANTGDHGGVQGWANLHLTELSRSGSVDGVLLGGADESTINRDPPCTSPWDSAPTPGCVSWRDPDVHPRPAALASLGAGPWVTVFGLHGTQGDASQPVVARLPDGANIQKFSLGKDEYNNDIFSCHHSAWNITGSRILCTRELSGDTTTLPGYEIHAAFQYRFDGAGWVGDGYAVRPGDVTTDPNLPAFHNLWLDPGVPELPVLVYKFGHWVATDRWVAATVFVSHGGSDDVLASRVVLFDTTGALPPWDLTDIVEAHEGVSQGSRQAVYSTAMRPT